MTNAKSVEVGYEGNKGIFELRRGREEDRKERIAGTTVGRDRGGGGGGHEQTAWGRGVESRVMVEAGSG